MMEKEVTRMAVRLTIVGLTAVVLLIGCARDNRPDPSPVSLQLSASPDVNPDGNGRPSPVLVRVYELRAAGTFESADFFALLEDDGAVLGNDLVNRWEYQLDPGEVQQVDANFQGSSGHIGVIAAYRNIAKAQWRLVEPIEAGREHRFSVRVGELAVDLQKR